MDSALSTFKSFDSADDCYNYFISKRLRSYDQKFQINFEILTKDVSPEKRAQCIQFIYKGCNTLQTSDDTLFHSSRLFDYYLANQSTNIETEEDTLKALASIIIAHKLNDVPKFSSICEKLHQTIEGETKLTTHNIVEKEMEFFKFLNNDAFIATPLAFLQVFCPLHFTEEQLELSRVLSLLTLFSAEISAHKAEDIAKSICSIACRLTKTEDLASKIFGEPADSSSVDLICQVVLQHMISDELAERIGEFDMNALIDHIKSLN